MGLQRLLEGPAWSMLLPKQIEVFMKLKVQASSCADAAAVLTTTSQRKMHWTHDSDHSLSKLALAGADPSEYPLVLAIDLPGRQYIE